MEISRLTTLLLLVLSPVFISTTDSTRNSYDSRVHDSSASRSIRGGSRRPRDKLLVVVIDGMRWDHLNRFKHRSGRSFPGFDDFLRGGVRTKYLQSVFPAEAFPAWQSINTGVYPEKHEIIGNQFYDKHLSPNKFFNHMDERMTGEVKWWNKEEPIWATAHRQGLKFVTLLWGRCDIPWNWVKSLSPEICENVFTKDDSKTMAINMESALIQFQQGKDAAIIYEDSLGKVSEDFGPLSREAEQKLHQLDEHLQFFLSRLREAHMENSVNIVLVSDHGMTYGANPLPKRHPPKFPINSVEVEQVDMGNVLKSVTREVRMVVGSGAYAMLYPRKPAEIRSLLEKVHEQLRGKNVDVYEKDDIPEHLHWKVHSHGIDTSKLLKMTQQGVSGYDPEEEDMRGIFMAHGPGFKSDGQTYDPIEIVDLYDMFCFLLDIKPHENTDGVWERFKELLRNGGCGSGGTLSLLLLCLGLAMQRLLA